MDPITKFRDLVEAREHPEKLTLQALPYQTDALAPVLPKHIVDYHYAFLSQGYVDRFNKGISPDFNFAGAFLHERYWAQFKPYRPANKPVGPSAALIDRVYGSFDKFVDEFVETGAKIEGSGWVYLSTNGQIKTIKNHAVRNDLAVIVDCWEHSVDEYGKNKEKYLRNIFKIVDWAIVNARL